MRVVVLVVLAACGRIGFPTDERASEGDGGVASMGLGDATWTMDPGATSSGGHVSVDARGRIWTMSAPIVPLNRLLTLVAKVTAVGSKADQHFSLEFAHGTAAYACDVARSQTSADLRWSNTTDGASYTHSAIGGVGGVYVGETFTLVVDHGSSVTCSMTTSDGSCTVGGQLLGVVADHVRIIAADVQIELDDFQHN